MTTSWKAVKKELHRNAEHTAAVAELEPWQEIARALIRYRIEHDITQTELAKLAGVSQPAIARLEAATHEPKLSTLGKVANALGGELVIDLAVDGDRHELATI